jgi:hypothetical protein
MSYIKSNIDVDYIQERLDICGVGKPKWRQCFNLSDDLRCKACGCPVMQMAQDKSRHCDLRKW